MIKGPSASRRFYRMKRRLLLRMALSAPLLGAGFGTTLGGILGLGSVLLPGGAGAAPKEAPPRKPAPPASRVERRLIVIDPGHGGHDPGAIGGRGTFEKDITLDIALEIARRLRGSRSVSVELTRDA